MGRALKRPWAGAATPTASPRRSSGAASCPRSAGSRRSTCTTPATRRCAACRSTTSTSSSATGRTSRRRSRRPCARCTTSSRRARCSTGAPRNGAPSRSPRRTAWRARSACTPPGHGAAAVQHVRAREGRARVPPPVRDARARHDDLVAAGLGHPDRQVRARHPQGLARAAPRLRLAARALRGRRGPRAHRDHGARWPRSRRRSARRWPSWRSPGASRTRTSAR